MSIEITEVGHRDSRLRKVQNKVAFMVPALISAFDYLGAFPKIGRASCRERVYVLV